MQPDRAYTASENRKSPRDALKTQERQDGGKVVRPARYTRTIQYCEGDPGRTPRNICPSRSWTPGHEIGPPGGGSNGSKGRQSKRNSALVQARRQGGQTKVFP